MTTQTQQKPAQGANPSTENKVKPLNQKASQEPKNTVKKATTPEERAQKIGHLALAKSKRDLILGTREDLQKMQFGADPQECEMTVRDKNGNRFHTTNPRLAVLFITNAIQYCEDKLQEIDAVIENELKTLTA